MAVGENILRLQEGLGLPTRDIIGDEHVGDLRTNLRGPNEHGIIHDVEYGRLCQKLGASHYAGDAPEPGSYFYWLYRNGLQDYDRQSIPWRRWLNRLFLWTPHYQRRLRADWTGGFKPYDQLQQRDFSTVVGLESFKEFAKMCDFLIAELKAAALLR